MAAERECQRQDHCQRLAAVLARIARVRPACRRDVAMNLAIPRKPRIECFRWMNRKQNDPAAGHLRGHGSAGLRLSEVLWRSEAGNVPPRRSTVASVSGCEPPGHSGPRNPPETLIIATDGDRRFARWWCIAAGTAVTSASDATASGSVAFVRRTWERGRRRGVTTRPRIQRL